MTNTEAKCGCGQPSCEAFSAAIKAGRLSENPHDVRYAGDYMAMLQPDGSWRFKHRETRAYLPEPLPSLAF